MSGDDKQALHAMNLDDAYVVERRLAHGVDGVTELVTLDGAGPFVRKRIPLATAHRVVWAALAECDCRYLPRVYTTYELPDEFAVVYSYVPGETLEQVMERRGHLPLAETVRIIGNLREAAGVLHAHGIIHADIAPRNVVLAEDGAHLIDFGIARMAFDAPRRDERAWGTRGFAAPEQHGFAEVDARSDVYAIGRLAGYLLTGAILSERSFEGELRCSGLVPEGVCRVLGRACAFEPSARYQTAEEFGRALAEAAESAAASGDASKAAAAPLRSWQVAQAGDAHAVEQESADTPRRAGRQPRRALIAVAVVIALAAVACAAFLVWRGVTARDAGDGDTPSAITSDPTSPGNDAAGNATSPAGGAGAASSSDDAPASLQITESWWGEPDGNGLFAYVFALKNTSDDLLISFPGVRIVGRDASGAIVSSDEQLLNTIFPGQTIYFGGIAGNGVAPEAVEFTPFIGSSGGSTAARGTETEFSWSNVSVVPDAIGNLSVVGEMSCTQRGAEERYLSSAAVTAVFRDGAGNIVYGTTGFLTLPAEGETAPFELTTNAGQELDYASVELYAIPW